METHSGYLEIRRSSQSSETCVSDDCRIKSVDASVAMEEKRIDELDDIGQDDFFGDEGNDEGQAVTMSPMAESRDLAALKTRLTTLGYQDGVEDGVEEVVQDGFDKGFAAGAAAGWEVGSLYGGCAAAAAALNQATASRGRRHPPSAEPRTGHGAGSTVPHVEDKGVREANECSETIDGHPTEILRGVVGPSTRTSEQGQHEGDRKQCNTFDEGLGSTPVGQEWGGIEELSKLAEELEQASLVGPDGPSVDKAGIFRRLKLAGPAGEAVSRALSS